VWLRRNFSESFCWKKTATIQLVDTLNRFDHNTAARDGQTDRRTDTESRKGYICAVHVLHICVTHIKHICFMTAWNTDVQRFLWPKTVGETGPVGNGWRSDTFAADQRKCYLCSHSNANAQQHTKRVFFQQFQLSTVTFYRQLLSARKYNIVSYRIAAMQLLSGCPHL